MYINRTSSVYPESDKRKEKYTFSWENRTKGRRLNGFTQCYVRDNREHFPTNVYLYINAFKTNRVIVYFECIVHAICCQTLSLFNRVYSRISYVIYTWLSENVSTSIISENRRFLYIFIRVCISMAKRPKGEWYRFKNFQNQTTRVDFFHF